MKDSWKKSKENVYFDRNDELVAEQQRARNARKRGGYRRSGGNDIPKEEATTYERNICDALRYLSWRYVASVILKISQVKRNLGDVFIQVCLHDLKSA